MIGTCALASLKNKNYMLIPYIVLILTIISIDFAHRYLQLGLKVYKIIIIVLKIKVYASWALEAH